MELSARYRRSNGLIGFIDISEIYNDDVIFVLAKIGEEKLYWYTRAVANGYIRRCLKRLTSKHMLESRKLIEIWEFPKDWIIAIDEELAFREFLVSGMLPPLLSKKALELATRHNISIWEIFST